MRGKILIPLLLLIGTLLVVLFYGPIDQEVIRWSKAHQQPWLKPVSAFITDFGVATGWLVGSLGLWLYWRYKAKKEVWADRARFFFISVAATGLAVLPLKLLFGKARPKLLFREELYGFQWFSTPNAYTLQSFPSGHTTTAFAVATALALLFPRFALLFYAGALLVGLSRIGVLAHYPSDVAAGAVLGTVLTLLLYNFDKITFKQQK